MDVRTLQLPPQATAFHIRDIMWQCRSPACALHHDFITCDALLYLTQPRCSKHKPAHDALHPEQHPPAARGRGGGGGRGAGHGSRGRRIRRAAPDRVRSKLDAELKLQNAAPDDNFDADADFHEDVLDAAESDGELGVAAAGAAPANADTDSYASPEATPPQSEDDDDTAVPPVQGPVQHFGDAAMATLCPRVQKCFRRWTITMASVLRAFADAAVRNPISAQPKCVSLVQRDSLVIWFAWQPDLQPQKPEGRVITLDDRCRVVYQGPGVGRQQIVDLTPELAAGTARVLFHTNTEHVRSKPADRYDMRMTDVILSRCWHMLVEPATIPCGGCGGSSTACSLCSAAMSSCCLSDESAHAVDTLGGLDRLEDAVAHCHAVSASTHALLWELRARRADVLCLFCNQWLDSRRSAPS